MCVLHLHGLLFSPCLSLMKLTQRGIPCLYSNLEQSFHDKIPVIVLFSSFYQRSACVTKKQRIDTTVDVKALPLSEVCLSQCEMSMSTVCVKLRECFVCLR